MRATVAPTRSLVAWVGAVAAVVACGCARREAGAGDAGAHEEALEAAAPAPHALVEAGAPRHRLTRACRTLAITGDAGIVSQGTARALGLDQPADGWVTLATAADALTVTLPRSARELGFVGPAYFAPCVGADEAWIVRGTFQGGRGPGEAPGAEVWVVTPFGIVRYGVAVLEVVVGAADARVSLRSGSAMVLPEGATAWEPIHVGAPRALKGASLGDAATAASADRCTKAEAASKALEDALTAPDAATSPGFGDLASRANDAHVLWRAACAVAKLRADPLAAQAPKGAQISAPRTR